jgi:hypothetical protein
MTPRYGSIALILIEKFHRFEEQMLVTISLTLALVPCVAALTAAAALATVGRTRLPAWGPGAEGFPSAQPKGSDVLC